MILQAGAAKVNITPPLGTRINGDFITHFANYIHDDLFARALVLKTEEQAIAFVIVDTCIIPQSFADETRKLISSATGIPAGSILVASTHTHAAGSLTDVHLGSIDMDYTRGLPARLVDAVSEAVANLQPATVGFSSIEVPEHVVCRRYYMKEGYAYINPVTGSPDKVKTNPIGAEPYIDRRVASPDKGLSYLAVRSLDSEWISILANYSLHYVGDWENGTISADYFGVFASYLENELAPGGKMVAMMTNGTSGDVNIWDFLQPDRYPSELFAKSKMIGEDLGRRLIGSMDTIRWESLPVLRSTFSEVTLKVEKPGETQLEEAARIIAETNYETITPDTPDDIRRLYAREQLLVERFPDTIECPVQAFRIGDVLVGALAGEFFAETGLHLKEAFEGKPYFTISMANGNIGYVPPKDQLPLGGYETWRCRYRCADENSEAVIREALAGMTASLL
ncbi:MAG: hypothetical protein ABS46_09400 [Cytophagaceae bacterium SCN 52-12]|nr:MAG: hypothetical protein ABS46_09400 [Cytophagaceae bacterium SCN 52-12]